ncbi:peptidylprolyl isomerase [Paracoccus limosus]|uniref:Parvulin-like PPIase n=1 Tax=Paracoccus limosus TaxID=913252 RepID=A0A844H6D6_9RHOB|nr:peptidylprolyl isomerase [Paracoccus limosus]
MRRILLGAAAAAMLAAIGPGALPALAQGNPFQPLVYVNDSAVTRYEVDQRVKFMQLLRAPDATPAGAEKALIDERLRNGAAKQIGVKPTPQQIDAALEEFASRGNLSTDQFVQLLEHNGIDRRTFEDYVVSGLLWRDFVRQRLVALVRVTDAEVDQEMKKIIETPQITSVSLSEIIIPAPAGQEGQAKALAERIAAESHSEARFAAFARQYSATPSAANGGRLPTTALTNLPPTLRPILLQMQPGQVSQPLQVQGAVVLFMLRATHGTLRPGAESQVLDFVRFRLSSAQEAARIAAVSDTCADLFVHARGLPAEQIQRQSLPQSQIPQGEAIRLAVLDENETTVVNYGGAVELLMLCKRSPALALAEPPAPVATKKGEEPAADPNALPQREEIRNQIFNRKVGEEAESYLADLRADAIIRRP